MRRFVLPVVVVVVMGTPGLGQASARAQSRVRATPQVWAVVVGIDRYEDTSIPPCQSASRDARAVAEWFTKDAGWGKRHVLQLNNFGQQSHGLPASLTSDLLATRENLDWAVKDWLGHHVQPDDVVVIYFAGQASARKPRPGAATGRVMLLPVDARSADINRTGWSLDETLDKAKVLAEKKARVVIWLDTSPFGRGTGGLTVEPGSPTGQDWLRSLTRWPRVTAWLANDARVAPERGPGASNSFTTALLKSLGTVDRAHNLVGTLQGLRDDAELGRRGFQAMGGIEPSVSLWSGGAAVVEQAVPELIIQAGHGDRITSVLVTADQSHVITASHDSTVRVWNLADRSLLRTLADPLDGVEALAMDRDNSVLIAGDGVGRLIGWDMTLDRPRPFYGPSEHTEGIVELAFLPEAKRFVSMDRAKRSVLWDGSKGAVKKLRAFTTEPISRLASARRPEPNHPGAAMAASVEPDSGEPGWLLTFDSQGNPLAKSLGPGGRITAIGLSCDGRQVASGDDKGRVVVREVLTGSLVYSGHFSGAIAQTRFSNAGLLLVADARSLRLIKPVPKAVAVPLVDLRGTQAPGESDRSAFSEDGRWLAACTGVEGRTLVWRIDEPGRLEPLATPLGLPSDDDSTGLSPAFAPDGRTLLVGDADGGLRSWSLEAGPAGLIKAEARPTILPSRGKVASLSPSPSGRYLLEITKDDLAMVWDLQQGRGCQALAGSWVAGGFLPDESKLVLVGRGNQTGAVGEVVLFDRTRAEVLPTRFERPVGLDNQPLTTSFGSVVVSKSGRWVAAASLEAQRPIACVWRSEDGKLIHIASDHDSGLTAVDISGDEKFLLTASEDGATKIWPLEDPSRELHAPVMTFFNPANNASAITSARFSPVLSGRVVTGTREGQLFLWDWEVGKPRTRLDLGKLEGSVNASTFSTDGRWLAASSSLNKSIRFWSIPDKGPPRAVDFRPRPHHGEQIGALAAWPLGSMIVSGGDDAALRFWNLKDQSLVGTLVAQVRRSDSIDWLAFTPQGLFDGSMPGESMVKWRVGDQVVTLQQSEDTHHVFQLADAFHEGTRLPEPKVVEEGPRLQIESPASDQVVANREVDVTVWSGEAQPSNLRLYQNGVPVRSDRDFQSGPSPHLFTTKVTLRRGENKLTAMASKPLTIDGQSNPLTLRYEGPEPPGRVHILAVGVSGYRLRPLKYAHLDAQRIAEFLQGQGVSGGVLDRPGERIVLVDRDVTPANIDHAFLQLREAVKGKPEDTVVLFLAGHTDTDARADQFCLLLPEFAFEPADPTEVLADSTNLGVATRGNSGLGLFRIKVGDPDVLPYVILYNRLARLEALQRLIIIDACQAGAILDDKAVKGLQRVVEKGSRKVRNAYLLAARRGEPANEADALQHGLLTYTLLQGLRASGLKPIPEDLGGFPGRPSADLDRDGVVTTDELVAYTNDALPRLARMFPKVVIRAANPLIAPPPANADSGTPDLEQCLKIQSTDTSFPLIPLPKPATSK